MTVPVDDRGRQRSQPEAVTLPARPEALPPPPESLLAPPESDRRAEDRRLEDRRAEDLPAEDLRAEPTADPGSPHRRSARDWGSNATLLTAVTVIISLGNYSYSFLVLHLLGARAFSRFGAAQGLLLVIGSGGMAAIPWAMARFIAQRPDGRARREAMHFGILASTLQGLVFAIVTGAILWSTAGPGVGALGAVSAFVCSVIAVPVGFLQGLDRIRTITGLRLLEFVTRYGAGVLILLLVGRSAPAALIGYPIGAVVLIAVGLTVCRSGLPPLGGAQATIRGLAHQSLGLGAIQVFLAMLGSLDSVSALAAHLGSRQTAGYQSVAVLGRIPLFMSAAIGLAAYVHVVNARTDGEVRAKMGQAVRLYSLVAVPFVVACLTVPDSLIHILIPSRYVDAPGLLRFTAISGVAVGWIDVVSTAHQARARFRPAIRILGAAAIAQPIVLICAGRIGGVWWFAAGLVAVSLVAAAVLTVNARAWLVPHVSPRAAALGAAALAGAMLLHGSFLAWIGLIAILGLLALRSLGSPSRTAPGVGDASLGANGAGLHLVDIASPRPGGRAI
jgi:O-antigen/teichoic acid export membrane protein